MVLVVDVVLEERRGESVEVDPHHPDPVLPAVLHNTLSLLIPP